MRLAHHPAGDLGEPVGDRAHQRKHRAADQHVVEVRDDEIRVVHLRIQRHRGDHHAGHAADDEGEEKRQDEQQRRAQHRPAKHERRHPAEDLHPVGDGDRHAGRGEEALAEPRQAGGEHVMHPQAEGQHAGRDRRHHQRQVAEHRPAREGRQDRGDHADRRQEDDVDLRVAEEPEQMLPQQHVAAFGRIEEMRADQAVEDQRRAGHHDRRHRQDDGKGGDQHRPDEQRHAVERHAGGALLEHRDDDLHRHRERRDLGEGDHLRPDVGALADAVLRPGQRHVGEPADIGPHVEHERRPQQNAAGEIHPVGECIQPRKRDVAGADHQRHEVDGDRLHHRHGEQEHHVRAVHGEDLVVAVGADDPGLRAGKLQPDQHRQHAAERQEDEGGGDVAPADVLVIDGGQPPSSVFGVPQTCSSCRSRMASARPMSRVSARSPASARSGG